MQPGEFQRRRLLVEHLLDGARQEFLLAARLFELGGAELGMVLLGMHGMRREMPERFVHAVHGELVLHRLERRLAGHPA